MIFDEFARKFKINVFDYTRYYLKNLLLIIRSIFHNPTVK